MHSQAEYLTSTGEYSNHDEALKHLLSDHSDTTFIYNLLNTNKEVLVMAEGHNCKRLKNESKVI